MMTIRVSRAAGKKSSKKGLDIYLIVSYVQLTKGGKDEE